MDLLNAIQDEVLKQKEEEAHNMFSRVADFRDFIATTTPAADVTPTANALSDLTPLKRKQFIAQVTVWDAKSMKGSHGKSNIEFHPGSVYTFRNVDGVGFFADIAKGSVQYERDVNDKIFEAEPPLKKRKQARDVPKKNGKAKMQTSTLSKSSVPDDQLVDDIEMAAPNKDDGTRETVTTRSKNANLRP
eukprot:jgi/Phyca11/99881/e_gw1.4.1070.1